MRPELSRGHGSFAQSRLIFGTLREVFAGNVFEKQHRRGVRMPSRLGWIAGACRRAAIREDGKDVREAAETGYRPRGAAVAIQISP